MADRTVTYTFRGDFTSLAAGLTAAGRATADLGGELTALDKNGAKMRAGLTQIGSTAGKIGLAAAAGFGVMVAAAANFDQAMSNVQAATHETSGNMELLRQAAIDAGQATQYSASEAAGAIEELAKAGVSTTDILHGGLTGALDLAAAGGLQVADAAQIAATALTQFQLAGEDVPHVADLLAAGAGKAQGDVTDLAMALKQSGLVASQMGVSIEETTGTLAAFASAGLLGSDAGTSFRTMLLRLANPTKESAALMEELGIQAYDAQGQFVGMESIAGQLAAAFENKTQAERDSALATIFGSDAIRAASVLYSQGADGIAEWTSKVNDQGYAAETAAIKMDNLKGDLEQLKGSLETAFIGAGSGSQGPLRQLVQGATDVVNAFNNLPGPAKNATTALLGVTAVLGGGVWLASKTIQGISNTSKALSDLGITADRTGFSLGRVARTAGGVLLVAGAVTALGNALAKATGHMVETSDLQRNLEAIANGDASDVIQQVSDSFDMLSSTANRVTDPLYEVTTAFGLFGNTPVDNAQQNISQVDEALASLVESGNADTAAKAFDRIAAAITGLPEGSSFNPAFIDGFDSYATALDNAAAASDDAAGASKGFGDAAQGAASGAQAEADAVRDATRAMQDHVNAALAAFDAETQWRQALKDAQAQAETNNAGIKGNSEAVLANRQALSGLAAAWNNQSAAVKNNVNRYQEARDAFIRTATAMGVPAKAARDLANSYLQIPKKVSSLIDVDDKRARAKLASVLAALRKWGLTSEEAVALLNDLATGKIKNVQGLIKKYGLTKAEATALLKDLAKGPLSGIIGQLNAIDGRVATSIVRTIHETVNRVSGALPKFATGGYTGDGGINEPAGFVHKGEVVIPQRYVKRDWSMLRARYGDLPGFASGGYVSDYARAGAGGTPAFDMVGPVNAATAALLNLADASKKELEARKKLLDKEFEAAKQRLDNLKQERASLVQSVKDVIAGGDLFTVTQPSTLSMSSGEWNQDYYDLLQQHNAALAEQGGVTSNVGAMLSEGRERLALIRQLKRMGIKGQALAVLATQPIEVLRELASDKGEAHLFAQQYNQLQHVAQAAGAFAGSAVYGKEIREQTAEVRELRKEQREANKGLAQRLKHVEDAVGNADRHITGAIKGAVGDGARRHR